jgi:hypothetical protein
LKLDGFHAEVEAMWDKEKVSANPFMNLGSKLRSLARGLQS